LAAIIVLVVVLRPFTDSKGKLLAVEEGRVRGGVIPVKSILPRRDSTFAIAVQELASVEAFNRADLYSRVAGPVKYIQKDLGNPVRQGELLVEIDAPDRDQDVVEKAAVVQQRRQEVRLARAKLKLAKAAIEVAYTNIDQKKADRIGFKAQVDFRAKELARIRILVAKDVTQPEREEEVLLQYQSAVAAHESANVAVRKAEADLKEAQATEEGAEADVQLRETLVDVARKDYDRAVALADFAKVLAPFDGIVVDRTVDVGSFVQDATRGHSEPFMSIARTDIVTVTMKVPDNYAPFVSRDTDAFIQMDEMPGELIRGKVTRFPSYIQNKDRTMRVEVDLYNGSEADYRRFVARGIANLLHPVGTWQPLQAAVTMATGQDAWRPNTKGVADPFPLHADFKNAPADHPHHLLPGMIGSMKLLLGRFDNAFLLPSGAVVSRGGKPYIYVVQEGKARRLPVRVQMDDGNLCKLAILTTAGDPKSTVQESVRELAGDEEVIISQQGEITEGQAVRATRTEW
jgi:multidrug efflux pump subunit AcrA (membrane-fusion protein)